MRLRFCMKRFTINNVDIIHLSDTHLTHDLLKIENSKDIMYIHTGDFCLIDHYSKKNYEKTFIQGINFLNWFSKFQGKKILISGNHEVFLNDESLRNKFIDKCNSLDIIFLDDLSKIEVISGLKICGAGAYPYINFNMCEKWAYYQNSDVFKLIPNVEIDLLIIHGPPQTDQYKNRYTCKLLNKYIEDRKERIKILLSGHIHEMDGEYSIGNTKVFVDFSRKN